MAFVGPIAQVYHLAALATKRAEFVIKAIYNAFFTGGTGNLFNFSARFGLHLKVTQRHFKFNILLALFGLLYKIQAVKTHINGVFIGAHFGKVRAVIGYFNLQ